MLKGDKGWISGMEDRYQSKKINIRNRRIIAGEKTASSEMEK